MDDQTDQPSPVAPPVGVPDLVGLCRLLNQAGVHYLVYGGLACLLHGHERMTRDADIYLGEAEDNIAAALAALRDWGSGYAAQLRVQDLKENVVVRICDRFVLDLATRVWGLDWESAWHHRRIVDMDGVAIPLLDRADLIRSKQTYREQDQWDVRILSALTGPEPGHPAER